MANSIFCCMPTITNSSSTFTPTTQITTLGQDHHHLPLLKFKQSFVDHKSSSTTIIDKNPQKKCIARVWREIHGLNNWKNLMEPLDPLLGQEVVRYGELVTACYKAFELNPTSRRYLNCKYGKKTILKEVGLAGSGYEVTKYIYATAPDVINPDQSRWIGYVAVSTDQEEVRRRLGRRDILVSFRGTVTKQEWIANLMSSLTPANLDPHDPRPDVKVEAGFLSLYTSDESGIRFGLRSCREQLLSEISRLLKKHKDEEISLSFAGHSMGSSLAVLLAYDIAELGLNRMKNDDTDAAEIIPVTVFSFGGPRVGNLGFKERCEELGVKVLRVVNVNDPITKLPGIFFNEDYFKDFRGPWRCSCYAHVGVELLLDFFKLNNPPSVHDLESYIGLLRSRTSCASKTNFNDDGQMNSLVEMAKGVLLGIAQTRFDEFNWINVAMTLIQSQTT